MTLLADDVLDHWAAVQPLLTIHDGTDYRRAVAVVNELLDQVATDESHPLYDLLDTLGTLVEAYEAEHIVLPEVNGAEMLAYLMAEHGLRQSDLTEVGTQGVVSEVLSGRRELNLRQVRALSKRFGVSAEVFI